MKPSPLLPRRLYTLLLLFVLVTGGFALYRDADFFVWNDTPNIVATDGPEAETWERVDKNLAESTAAWSRDPVGQLLQTARLAFRAPSPDGYRPLDSFAGRLSCAFTGSHGPTLVQLLLAGATYGAFAVCLFLLARRYTQYEITPLLALVLMFGTPGLVGAAWVVIIGLQVMVPLMICLALLLYWQILEAPRARWLKVFILSVILLIGPWFREFCGISCLLIGFLELQRARRPTPLMGMAGLFFLHAVFPTALVKLFYFPDLPLLPVTRLGSLGTSLHAQGVHWYMAWQFLPLLPPLLMLLATCNALRRAGQQLRTRPPSCQADWKARGWQYCVVGVMPALWLAVVVALWLSPRESSQELLGYTLCLYIAVVGLQVDLFLVVWFLLAFVPLMRVAVETVHFLYALVPASIILACCMESLWQWAAARQGRFRGIRYALTLALGIIVADQLLFLYGSYRVMHGQAEGVRAVAAQLRQRIPQGSLVISNVVHAVDVQWAAGEHYENAWSLPWLRWSSWSRRHPARVIDDPAKLEQLLVKSQTRNKVYFLDCDFDYLPDKVAHRHQFVHRCETDKQDLGTIHVYSAAYPFADPLRHLIGRANVPFLGPPDLVNDFYRGHAIDGRWFTDEVYAEYHLYEVTGTQVSKLAITKFADSLPHLMLSGVHGFNIIGCEDTFYGLPQSSGAFELEKVRAQQYPVCFTGKSVQQVKQMIEDSVRPAVSQKPNDKQTTK